jgi:hypothetical protein
MVIGMDGTYGFTHLFLDVVRWFAKLVRLCIPLLAVAFCIACRGDTVEIRGFIPAISTASPRHQTG